MSLTFVPRGSLVATYASRTEVDGRRHWTHYERVPVIAVDDDGNPYVVHPTSYNRSLCRADSVNAYATPDGPREYVGLTAPLVCHETIHAVAPPGWYVVVMDDLLPQQLPAEVTADNEPTVNGDGDAVFVTRFHLPLVGWTADGEPLVHAVQGLTSDRDGLTQATDDTFFFGKVLDVVYEPTRTVSGLASAVLVSGGEGTE